MTEYKRGAKKEVPEPDGIVLDKKFRIMPLDDKNVELQELITTTAEKATKTRNKGEVYHSWVGKGYYSQMNHAIKAYCNLSVMRTKNMCGLLAIIEELQAKVDNNFTVKVDG